MGVNWYHLKACTASMQIMPPMLKMYANRLEDTHRRLTKHEQYRQTAPHGSIDRNTLRLAAIVYQDQYNKHRPLSIDPCENPPHDDPGFGDHVYSLVERNTATYGEAQARSPVKLAPLPTQGTHEFMYYVSELVAEDVTRQHRNANDTACAVTGDQ